MTKLTASRPLLWAILAIPAAVMAWRYATDVMTYGQVLHATGDYALWFLIAALAVTPIRLAFPRAAWSGWLLRRRRELGLAAFGYSVFHLVDYVVKKADLARIIMEGQRLSLLTGWLAFLIFIVLAATSNNLSTRRLGPAWKTLHLLVYPAAALTMAHWYLEAYYKPKPLLYVGLIVAIEAVRIVLVRLRRAKPAAA